MDERYMTNESQTALTDMDQYHYTRDEFFLNCLKRTWSIG